VPSLWVENESTSKALALWYSCRLRKQAQRERTKLSRLSGVFWNERRCIVQVRWCRESCGCWQRVTYRRKRELRWRREDGIYILEFLPFDSYSVVYWLMNIKLRSLHIAQLTGTSWMRSFETRFGTPGEDSLRRRALLWHLIPLLQPRPPASRSKLSSSQVVPTVHQSNTATNA